MLRCESVNVTRTGLGPRATNRAAENRPRSEDRTQPFARAADTGAMQTNAPLALGLALLTVVAGGCTEEHYYVSPPGQIPSSIAEGTSPSPPTSSGTSTASGLFDSPHPAWMIGSYERWDGVGAIDKITTITLTADGWATILTRANSKPDEVLAKQWRVDPDGKIVAGNATMAVEVTPGCRAVAFDNVVYEHEVAEGTCPQKTQPLTAAESSLLGAEANADAKVFALIQLDRARFFRLELVTAADALRIMGVFRLDDAGVLRVTAPNGSEVFKGRVSKSAKGDFILCPTETCITIEKG